MFNKRFATIYGDKSSYFKHLANTLTLDNTSNAFNASQKKFVQNYGSK